MKININNCICNIQFYFLQNKISKLLFKNKKIIKEIIKEHFDSIGFKSGGKIFHLNIYFLIILSNF